LHLAIGSPLSEEMCEALIEGGADVDAADINGWTPLHWAAWSGSEGTIRLLLEHGARVNEFGFSDQKTALDHAAESNY
jgi:ankyrin repeat/protein kinase domain-containing protein 1